jgi:hypothetical protein
MIIQMGRSEIAKEAELAWQLTQQALEEARLMPGGPERSEALKRAGKLRFEADKLCQAIKNNADEKQGR